MFDLLKRWGRDGTERRKAKGFWKDAVRWNKQAAGAKRKPNVFPSMCDWLDLEIPIEWLLEFLELIRTTRNLNWQLLTKRPENWRSRIVEVQNLAAKIGNWQLSTWCAVWLNGTPPENVWIGVSVENQKYADIRIPILLTIPAIIRFLSCEPLLESIRIIDALRCDVQIHWVIVGGESGKDRRDCGLDAIVSLVQQCFDANVACFVKQDVGLQPGMQGRIPDSVWKFKQFPEVELAA